MGNLYDAGEELCGGRFVVERFLGRGGMGEAYLTNDKILGQPVVCKVALTDFDWWDEFKSQYWKLHRISAVDVVKPLGFFAHEDVGGLRAVISMECAKGQHLGDWLRNRPVHESLAALARVAASLGQLHGEGMTHGDFRYGVNVLVDAGDRIVLIDPDADLLGTSSTVGGERLSDLKSLAELISAAAPDYTDTILRAMVERLRTEDRRELATEAAAAIRGAIRQAPIVAGSYPALMAAADAYRDRSRQLRETLDGVRRHRRDAAVSLAALVERLASPFEFVVEVGDDGTASAESKPDVTLLSGRWINCLTRRGGGGDRWAITFEGLREFHGRAYLHPHNLIAAGRFVIGPDGRGHRAEGDVQLLIEDDGTPLLRATRPEPPRRGGASPRQAGEWVPADREWVEMCLASLAQIEIVRTKSDG